MNPDIYALLDTTLKIGLGAFIAGVFGYLKVSADAKNTKEREFRDFRKSVIVSATEKIELYFSSLENYISRLDALARNGFKAGNPGLKDLDLFKEVDRNLCELRSNRASALSSLELIGVSSISELSGKLLSLEGEVRLPIVFEDRLPGHDDIRAFSEKLKLIISDYYKLLQCEINDIYD